MLEIPGKSVDYSAAQKKDGQYFTLPARNAKIPPVFCTGDADWIRWLWQ
ncbi:MAG: hypothetical protein Q4A06_01175 [Cardiobacteriaceae bacterium]|nr:hypothetical protein [Cardiobacteriaceae bacterium]